MKPKKSGRDSEMRSGLKRKQRDTLVESHEQFVRTVSKRLMGTLGLPMSFLDELVSAGYMGLVEAAERYNPSSGHSFKTFAYLRIRGSIIDSLRNNSDLSGKAYRYAKALQAMHEVRESELDIQPPEEFQKDKSGKTKRLARVMGYVAQGAIAFKMSIGDAESELSSSNNPEEILTNRQEAKKIRDLVETLPEKERYILEQYYFQEKSFSEIIEARKELSKSWVSRLHTRALKRLAQKVAEDEAQSV